MLLIFLQTNLVDTANALTATGQGTGKMSYFDFAVKGGWLMIPIAILSVIAVYIFIERYAAIGKVSKIDAHFMNRIRDYFHEGKIEQALTLCRTIDNPSARMIEKGVTRVGRPLNDIHTAIENVGQLEVSKLEKGLALLATCAGAAPMLGFLGTVVGMVKAFYDMSRIGDNVTISVLSSGVYQAMITTVAGLIVGIFAYFAYNILVSKVDKVVNQLEVHTTEFMDILNEPVK